MQKLKPKNKRPLPDADYKLLKEIAGKRAPEIVGIAYRLALDILADLTVELAKPPHRRKKTARNENKANTAAPPL